MLREPSQLCIHFREGRDERLSGSHEEGRGVVKGPILEASSGHGLGNGVPVAQQVVVQGPLTCAPLV